MSKDVFIVTANGRVFKGKSFGAEKEVTGELVFTTGMTGYMETLTDPSFFGHIVIQTFPLIGNYGVIPEDVESKKPHLSAYIVREKCDMPSNFRAKGTLEQYLKDNDIPAVYGVDTRELTKNVREAGAMNAKITFKEPSADGLDNYKIIDAVKNVTCALPEFYGDEKSSKRVVVWDFGSKDNIVREFVKRGCYVIKVPSFYTAEQILEYSPSALMLSNGPGDPKDNPEIIQNIKKLIGKLPIFGICLGHQLFALAMGGTTKKMKYGHRGGNQPAKDTKSGRVYITSQNHGYEVLAESIKEGVLSYVNANDGTCEGMDYPKLNAFTVQFHPEACSGPLDTAFLFDKFLKLTEDNRNA